MASITPVIRAAHPHKGQISTRCKKQESCVELLPQDGRFLPERQNEVAAVPRWSLPGLTNPRQESPPAGGPWQVTARAGYTSLSGKGPCQLCGDGLGAGE